MKFYIFRTVLLSVIRSLFTVHSVMIYVIQICMTYIITECTVNKLLMTDRRTVRNM